MFGLVTKKQAEKIAEQAVEKFSRHLKAQYGLSVAQWDSCDAHKDHLARDYEVERTAYREVSKLADALGFERKEIKACAVYVKKAARRK